MVDAGVGAGPPLVDGVSVPPLSEGAAVVAACCVDTFATVSLGPDVATTEACRAIRAVLEASGRMSGTSLPLPGRAVFAGLDVLGDSGVIGCKSERRRSPA
eukprot:6583502-Pyramimonas_sp.AAC.1